MDHKTRDRLSKIMKSIPKEMLKGGMKTIKPDESKREAIEYLASKGNPLAQSLLRSGSLDEKPRQEMSQSGAKRIEDYVAAKVESELKSGKLPPAEKDDFMKKVEANLNG